MRILAIDIETRPNLAYVWGIWDQNINLDALVEHQQMICFVSKWVGEKGTEFHSVENDGQEAMIRRAWELLDEADAVVHYNGRRFDIPHLNREFLRLDLTPPSPYKQIDLLSTAKREFKFASNKLAHVSRQMGLEGKVDTGGYKLWLDCMAGDKKAWQRMKKYNVRDVILLEELYYKFRPWIRSHPSFAAHMGGECPACGSPHLHSRGYVATAVSRYQRLQCTDCGKWSRSSKRLDHTRITGTPIS